MHSIRAEESVLRSEEQQDRARTNGSQPERRQRSEPKRLVVRPLEELAIFISRAVLLADLQEYRQRRVHEHDGQEVRDLREPSRDRVNAHSRRSEQRLDHDHVASQVDLVRRSGECERDRLPQKRQCVREVGSPEPGKLPIPRITHHEPCTGKDAIEHEQREEQPYRRPHPQCRDANGEQSERHTDPDDRRNTIPHPRSIPEFRCVESTREDARSGRRGSPRLSRTCHW